MGDAPAADRGRSEGHWLSDRSAGRAGSGERNEDTGGI